MFNALRTIAAAAVLIASPALAQANTLTPQQPQQQPTAPAQPAPQPPRSILEGSSSKFPTIDPKTIRKIRCSGGHGTGFVMAKGKIMTAYHVIANQTGCTDDESGEILTVVYQNPSLDVAVMGFTATAASPKPLALRCTPYETTATYYSFGYAGVGPADLMITRMRGMDGYIDGQDSRNKTPFFHMRALSGVLIPGMSGGPILDDQGRVVGLNNLTAGGFNYGMSRELSDTIFCDGKKK